MEIQTVDIGKLNPAEYNPRKDLQPGDTEYERLKASLDRWDLVEPLVWNSRTGHLVGGHQRLKILRERGDTEVEVSVVDLDEQDERALNLALNRIQGDWDRDLLAGLIAQLEADGFDLSLTGFEDDEITDLLTWHSDQEGFREEEDPDLDLPEEATTQLGQLVQLGDHRLLCGDASSPTDLQRLMGDEEADLVWTDPPYGVVYVGKTADELTIENDDLQGDALRDFLRETLGNAWSVTRPGGAWYVAAPAGPNFLPFAQVLTEFEVWRQTLVWVKDSLVLGRSDYHYRHEAIFYGWKRGKAHRPPPERSFDTVWEVPRPKRSEDHPTMKPVPLVRRAITNSTPLEAVVLDPFGGSGSTLIAAEQSARRARLLEIDPRYCDVTIRRWEQYTGHQAEVIA